MGETRQIDGQSLPPFPKLAFYSAQSPLIRRRDVSGEKQKDHFPHNRKLRGVECEKTTRTPIMQLQWLKLEYVGVGGIVF